MGLYRCHHKPLLVVKGQIMPTGALGLDRKRKVTQWQPAEVRSDGGPSGEM